MRRSTRTMLLCGASAAAIAFGQQAAEAADVLPAPYDPGHLWYVSLFGGASFEHEFEYDGCYTSDFVPPAAPGPCYSGYFGDPELETGFIVGGAIGLESSSHPGLRFDVEFALQSWDVDTFYFEHGVNDPTYYGTYSATGDVDAFTILADVWYDFEQHTQLTPYVGGGIGVGFVDPNIHFVDDPATGGYDESVFGLYHDATGFAFQLGAGVLWDISPHTAVDLSYRFRGIVGLDFDQRHVGHDLTTPTATQIADLEGDLFSHTVQAGIVFKIPPR